MRINNNIMAMNTHRQYSINNTNVAKSVEKLSSGYRINRAGDDAAGLAISEKMRAQIRGLTMASKNSQDAISLVQTAEGALQETHNILQRMRELAVQSASDTNETTIDRDALNKEFQALIAEIDDTAAKTKFNDMGLIDGSFSAYKVASATGESGSGDAGTAKIYAQALSIGATGTTVDDIELQVSVTQAKSPTDAGAATITMANGVTTTATATFDFDAEVGAKYNGKTLTFEATVNGGMVTINVMDGDTVIGTASTTNAAGTVKIEGLGTFELTAAAADTANLAEALNGAKLAVGTAGVTGSATVSYGGEVYKLEAGQTKLQLSNGVALEFDAIKADFSNIAAVFGLDDVTAAGESDTDTFIISVTMEKGTDFVVQTGANKGDELAISIDKMDSKTLGVWASNVAARAASSNAIAEVNDAINKVSTQRAALGALQNRMEHKIANLDTSAENLQAAEARIRDLDMAKEMTTFTRNNILSQAATAMLAQANALPQGVLQLLR